MIIDLDNVLPIGSIVLLKEGEKRLMVFGIGQEHPETSEIFDYVGVIYPEGNLGVETTFLFNHEDIDEVFFMGYADVERQDFIARLKEGLSEAEKMGLDQDDEQ